MSILALTESDLKTYQDKLTHPSTSRSGILTELRVLYERYQVNEKNLIDLESNQEMMRIEKEYLAEKQRFNIRISELKILYKQIDNRIASVEQKLSRGIPEDLNIIDKLIAEQEAIIVEQEKLNAEEAFLTQQVSTIDVTYGKAREKLEQKWMAKQAALKPKFEEFSLKLIALSKKIKTKVNALVLIPVLGVPLLIELIASIIGVPISLSSGKSPNAAFHYLFISTLVLTEIFLAERIRNVIYSFFAVRSAKSYADELSTMYQQHSKQIAKFENSSGMRIEQLLEKINTQ